MNIPVSNASILIKEAPLDVLACEMAPIHTPGSVQSGTTLLLFRHDTDQLAVASDNLETLFHAPAASLIGSAIARFFCADDSAAFYRAAPTSPNRTRAPFICLTAYRSGGQCSKPVACSGSN